MKLSPKTQRLSRIFVITGIVTYFLSYFYFLIGSHLSEDYCGQRSAPSHEFCKIADGLGDLLLVPLAILIGLCILSVLGWAALRSDRRGKILILTLLVLITVLLWIVIRYGNHFASFMLYALVILLAATTAYNVWEEKMRKRRGFFFLFVFLLLVVFAVPLPLRCPPRAAVEGDMGGFGANVFIPPPCHSIFSHTYWNNPTVESRTREETTFFFEFVEHIKHQQQVRVPSGGVYD